MFATILTTGLFVALHGGAFEAGFIPVMNVLTMSLLMTVVLEYAGSLVAPVIMRFICFFESLHKNVQTHIK